MSPEIARARRRAQWRAAARIRAERLAAVWLRWRRGQARPGSLRLLRHEARLLLRQMAATGPEPLDAACWEALLTRFHPAARLAAAEEECEQQALLWAQGDTAWSDYQAARRAVVDAESLAYDSLPASVSRACRERATA